MFIFCSITLATEDTYQGTILNFSYNGDTKEVSLNPKYFGDQNLMLASEENPNIKTLRDFSKFYHAYTTVFNVLLVYMQNGMSSEDEFNFFNREFVAFYHRYYQTVYRAYQNLEGEFAQESEEVWAKFNQEVLALHELFFQGGKRDEKFSINALDDARDLYIRLSDIILQNT